jgi:hypothetical protein
VRILDLLKPAHAGGETAVEAGSGRRIRFGQGGQIGRAVVNSTDTTLAVGARVYSARLPSNSSSHAAPERDDILPGPERSLRSTSTFGISSGSFAYFRAGFKPNGS